MNDVAVDTNILIYAHCSGFAEHIPAKLALESILQDQQGRLNFTVGVLHEFLHVISDPRRFQPHTPVEQALEIVSRYHGRQNVRILETGENDLLNAMTLLRTHRLGRNRIADTLLAATLRRYGVSNLFTKNARDYRVFDFLTVHDPTTRKLP